MRSIERLLGAVLIAGVGCQPATSPHTELRVVSLSEIGTQLVVDLGAAGSLIAVDEASSSLEPLRGRPVATPARVLQHDPSLVLIPASPAIDEWLAEEWRAAGVEVLEVSTHGAADVYGALRTVGIHLGIEERAKARISQLADPLAVLSSSSIGKRRPTVIPIVSLDPLELAGGHSAVADLIQIAGAEVVTHGNEIQRVPSSSEAVRALRADVVLVAFSRPLDEGERALADQLSPPEARVEFVEVDERRLWLGHPIGVACEVWRHIAGEGAEPDPGSPCERKTAHAGE